MKNAGQIWKGVEYPWLGGCFPLRSRRFAAPECYTEPYLTYEAPGRVQGIGVDAARGEAHLVHQLGQGVGQLGVEPSLIAWR